MPRHGHRHIPRTPTEREQFEADMTRLRERLEQKQRLAQLRYRRTLTANRVKDTMTFLLSRAVPVKERDPATGLPTWWPYWGEQLKGLVRVLVVEARAIQHLEACLRHEEKREGEEQG